MATEDLLGDSLVSNRVVDSCRNVASFSTRVLEGQEDVRAFHKFLPRLLSATFGTDSKRGWIHSVKSEAEARALYDLLNSRGPLFRTIVSQYGDQRTLYELLFNKLPMTVQKILLSGDLSSLPLFYNQRLVVENLATGVPAQQTDYKLKLNMVEYFLYCFIYSAVVSLEQIPSDWKPRSNQVTPWPSSLSNLLSSTRLSTLPHPMFSPSTLYRDLFMEYLRYFLPFPDSTTTVPSSPPSMHTRPPASPTALKVLTTSFGQISPTGITSTNLPTGVIQSPVKQQVPQRPPHVFIAHELGSAGTRTECGLRLSDFFVRCTGELWMNQNRYELDPITHRPNTLYGYIPPTPDMLRYSLLLVRQMGGINVFTTDQPRNDEFIGIITSRKMSWQALRKRAYEFVQLGLALGSADINFELMVDFWLTYIQPWRAVNPSNQFTQDWLPFVLENFLLYTMPLSIFLTRMSRLDVTESPMNVAVLDRAMSAVSDPELLHVLHKIEQSLQAAVDAATPVRPFVSSRSNSVGYASPPALPPPPVTPSSSLLTNTQVETVRSHFRQTEGPNYEWQPFFTTIKSEPISSLHDYLGKSINRLRKTTEGNVNSARSTASRGFSLLTTSPAPSATKQQKPVVTVERVTQIEVNLQKAFPKIPGAKLDSVESFIYQPVGNYSLIPDMHQVRLPDSGLRVTKLTDEGRDQVRRGLRKCTNKDVPIIGSADHLIRTDENATLVRLATHTSHFLNQQYLRLLEYLQHRFHLEISHEISHLRFNLRPLASYSNILFFFVSVISIWAIMRVFGIFYRLIVR